MALGPFPLLPTNEQQLKKVIDNIFNQYISSEFPAKIIIALAHPGGGGSLNVHD